MLQYVGTFIELFLLLCTSIVQHIRHPVPSCAYLLDDGVQLEAVLLLRGALGREVGGAAPDAGGRLLGRLRQLLAQHLQPLLQPGDLVVALGDLRREERGCGGDSIRMEM